MPVIMPILFSNKNSTANAIKNKILAEEGGVFTFVLRLILIYYSSIAYIGFDISSKGCEHFSLYIGIIPLTVADNAPYTHGNFL